MGRRRNENKKRRQQKRGVQTSPPKIKAISHPSLRVKTNSSNDTTLRPVVFYPTREERSLGKQAQKTTRQDKNQSKSKSKASRYLSSSSSCAFWTGRVRVGCSRSEHQPHIRSNINTPAGAYFLCHHLYAPVCGPVIEYSSCGCKFRQARRMCSCPSPKPPPSITSLSRASLVDHFHPPTPT